MYRIILLSLFLPSLVLATDCETDADCGEHEFCQRFDVAVGAPCSIDEDGNEDCPEPSNASSTGECVPGPISCETDEDCPGISSCVERAGGIQQMDCPDDDDSEEPCDGEPVEEPATRSCEYVPVDCQTDDDCGEGLACEDVTPPCAPNLVATPACPEGEDCPEPEPAPQNDTCDDQEQVFQCMPQQIECETDAECPSEWSCETIVVGVSCSGSSSGGSTPGEPVEPTESMMGESSQGSDGGAPPAEDREDDDESSEDSPEPPQTEEVTTEDCVEESMMICVPEGYEHYQGSPLGASASGPSGSGDVSSQSGPSDTEESSDNGSSADGGEAPSDSSDESGCDCSVADNTGLGSLWAFVLLLGCLPRRKKHLN